VETWDDSLGSGLSGVDGSGRGVCARTGLLDVSVGYSKDWSPRHKRQSGTHRHQERMLTVNAYAIAPGVGDNQERPVFRKILRLFE
jgi:hypothetical protein